MDEVLLVSVTCIAFIELAAGNYQAAHSHFNGVTAIIRYVLENNRKLDPLMTYVIQTAWNANAIVALFGYGLAIPSRYVNRDVGWVKKFGIGDHVEKWIRLELRIMDYLYEIAMYKDWAQRLRQQDEETSTNERNILKRGEALESVICSWGSQIAPPYEIRLLPEDDVRRSFDDKTRFLDYPQLQFYSSYHAEIYLLWYTALLILSYVKHPHPGASDQQRLTFAITFCQCLAALGDEYGTMALKSLSFGLFYATLTFGNQHPYSIFLRESELMK